MSVSATQVTYELPQSEELEPVPEPQSDVTSVCTPLALIIVAVRYSFEADKSPLAATPRLKLKTVGAGVGADGPANRVALPQPLIDGVKPVGAGVGLAVGIGVGIGVGLGVGVAVGEGVGLAVWHLRSCRILEQSAL